MNELLYGVAYYDEYMPESRAPQDMELMKEAGINVIRIAESTWATEEPEPGVFDFTHVKTAMEAAKAAGISVIVGTPTYAIPPWLAAAHPEILAVTERGKGKYGPRQNMDITSPIYRFYGERVIRKLMECVSQYDNLIGVQLDNETKHYHTSGPNVQKQFTRHLRNRFGTVEEMNRQFGFNYWSNRVDSWESVPDPTGSINGSYRGEFEIFRRGLVTEFLQWQSDIVRGYLKPEQFITHNFDYEWRGYSFGIQPDVDHKAAAKAVTIAGCDIYHPTQDSLSGKEIAFGGDVCRSLQQNNYLVLETQAQGHVHWTPYPGQLRLQAFSHLASGANAVLYWHWHSIHNAMETYWKGLLSHNLKPNAPYREATTIGADFKALSPHLVNLKKSNKAAILVSNESLTALENFPLPGGKVKYNDVVRSMYDALFELNVECDILFPQDEKRLGEYDFIAVPALYSAPDSLLSALADYVKAGGTLAASFKTGFTDDCTTVAHEDQPHLLTDCFGMTYDQFTQPQACGLVTDLPLTPEEKKISVWMELLTPTTAQVAAAYDHPVWGTYAGVTVNKWGKGTAAYVGCYPSPAYLKAFFKSLLEQTGFSSPAMEVPAPIALRSGTNQLGKEIHYYLNYSPETVTCTQVFPDGVDLLTQQPLAQGSSLTIQPWGVVILEC